MADRTGEHFGNYRLERLLGQGGYAEVYLGQHLRLNLQAAIKVLHTHLTKQEASHFEHEAETIAALMHPSIVRILDYDVQEGVPFLVMDYAPGGSLRQRYPKGSVVPLPLVISSVKQVAAALRYAHERKFIHRDVKPENMLLGRHDEILLSDFGLAALSHSSGSLSTKEAVGTLAYMAPEQIEGHPRAASDQYALGCVVYEWLCGARPFEGSPTEVMVQQLSMPPQALRERLSAIPSPVEQVVLRALDKNPKGRFASVVAFAAALEEASQHASSPTALVPGEQPTPFADPLSGLELLAKSLPLVGRDSELRLLCALLDTVALNRQAGARAVTISGEMGAGKSRLLAEMCAEARSRGFRVLESRAYEAAAMFPYLPFMEALRPVLRSASPQQLRRYMGLEDENKELNLSSSNSISLYGAPLVTALSSLFPELPRMVQVAVTSEVLSPDQVKFRLFESIATLLERMSLDYPVLLCIDNLHWADSASLELMMSLSVRLHTSQIALAGATRPPGSFNRPGSTVDNSGTASANLAAARALGELMRQGLLLFIPLGPLNANAMEEHVHALLPGTLPESLIQSLLSRAGGNPFFLEELVRTITQDGGLILTNGFWQTTRSFGPALPQSITLAVEQRLQELSISSRELLRVASLFGHTFPLQPLEMVMETIVATGSIRSSIDAALQAGLIAISPISTFILDLDASAQLTNYTPLGIYTSQDTSVTYMFCQGIVQEVLSQEITTQRANALHGAIGKALEASYGENAHTHAAELATHFVLSGEKEPALRWSLLAGENASRLQAHREVISHFRTALLLLGDDCHPERSEGSPARLHFIIGESFFKLGELEQALNAYQQALEQIKREQFSSNIYPSPYSLLSAQANRCLADVYRMQGKYELALAHLQAARKSIDLKDGDSLQAYESLEPVAWISSRTVSVETNDENLQQVSVTERILLLQAQATLDILLFRGQEAEEAFWQSFQLAIQIGDRGGQAFALHFIGWIRGWGEHIHEAIRLLEQARDLFIAAGDPFRAALGDQALGIIYQALGEMEKARLYNLRGFELARRYGVRYVLGWLYWNQGVMALGHGDWSSSASYLNQSMQEAQATNNARLKAVTLQAQAELSFRQGDWLVAEQQFKDAIQASINTEWYASIMALYGHFLAITGRRSAAQAQLERAVSLQEPVGYSGHYYIPFLAEAFLHLGANEQASTYIQRIQSLHGFMYYGVSVDRILGEVAALQGNWNTAQQAFEDGQELCKRANNQPEQAAILHEQARMLLMRSKSEIPEKKHALLQEMHRLCDQAQELFLIHHMQRAANLVQTLREGAEQLELQDETPSHHVIQQPVTHPGYLLNLHLTKRELEVLRLVAEGYTDREVADILVISSRTVNRHLGNMYVKLDVPGRAAAVAFAIRQGLVG